MRLLIVGTLKGQLSLATKIAIERGAQVTSAESVDQAMAVMRARGADLVMIDVVLSVKDLVERFEAERMRTPIVACGTGTDARAAVAAIQAGAREYIPLPPDPELIAAVIEAVSRDNRSFVYRDEAMARVVRLAEQVARALVGRTVAEVERELILDTLDHCLGNRTHAARILGISIRTLRNKLNEYTAEGVPVPGPGEARVASA